MRLSHNCPKNRRHRGNYNLQTCGEIAGNSSIAHERAETPSAPTADMPVSCVSLCAVLLAGPSSIVAMLAHARGPLRTSPWAARAKMSAGVAVPETFFWDGKLQWDPDGKGACLIIPDGTKHIWPLEAFARCRRFNPIHHHTRHRH